MSRVEIDDPRKWRVSMSGYSIKTGWSDEKKIVAQIPATTPPDVLMMWIEVAQGICDAHNATLPVEADATRRRIAMVDAIPAGLALEVA